VRRSVSSCRRCSARSWMSGFENGKGHVLDPRSVHRGLGVLEVLLGIRTLDLADRDSYAGRNVNLAMVERERSAKLLEDPLRDSGRVSETGEAVEQDGELVAGDAGGDVGRADGFLDASRRLQQEPITAIMPQALVDHPKTPQVEIEEGTKR